MAYQVVKLFVRSLINVSLILDYKPILLVGIPYTNLTRLVVQNPSL